MNGIAVMMNPYKETVNWTRRNHFGINVIVRRQTNPQEKTTYKSQKQILEMRSQLKHHSLFSETFYKEVFDIILLTKLYASQHNNHNFQISVNELKIFFFVLYS